MKPLIRDLDAVYDLDQMIDEMEAENAVPLEKSNGLQHDFPMLLGKSGVYLIRPKSCAGLILGMKGIRRIVGSLVNRTWVQRLV